MGWKPIPPPRRGRPRDRATRPGGAAAESRQLGMGHRQRRGQMVAPSSTGSSASTRTSSPSYEAYCERIHPDDRERVDRADRKRRPDRRAARVRAPDRAPGRRRADAPLPRRGRLGGRLPRAPVRHLPGRHGAKADPGRGRDRAGARVLRRRGPLRRRRRSRSSCAASACTATSRSGRPGRSPPTPTSSSAPRGRPTRALGALHRAQQGDDVRAREAACRGRPGRRGRRSGWRT